MNENLTKPDCNSNLDSVSRRSRTTRPHARFDLNLPRGPLWVFGYGSLMWRPGFVYEHACPARLYGFSRRLCIWSIHYRGCPRQPGLVVGLAPGGSCHGIAFAVAEPKVAATLDYLYQREMVNEVYHPRLKTIYFAAGQTAQALTFVAKPGHPQYARPMADARAVAIVKNAVGPHGSNAEYVLNTAHKLDQLGLVNTELHRIARAVAITMAVAK